MKTLLFARTYQHAKEDYLRFLDSVDVQRVVVITNYRDAERARGIRGVNMCFLDGWWRDWTPFGAHTVYNLWPVLFEAESIWELDDTTRTEYVRKAYGLDASWEVNKYHRYTPQDGPLDGAKWYESPAARTYERLVEKGAEPLPGLDDKPGSKNPLGGIVFKEIFDIEDPSGSYPLYADWFIRTHDRDVETHRNADRARRAREEWELENARAKAFRNALIHEYVLMQLNSYEPNLSLLNGVTVD